MNNEDKHEMINAIGVWALRLLLVGGAIYCGATGKTEIASMLMMAIIATFFFL